MWPRPTWELIWEVAKTDFTLRFRATRLGYLWSVIKPLATFLIINAMFSHIFRRGTPDYALQLLLGIIVWSYFTEGTRLGGAAFTSKAKLLTRVPLPKLAFLLAAIVHAALAFGLNLIVLGLFFAAQAHVPSAAALAVIAAVAVLTTLTIFGASLALAPLQVRLRDTEHVWNLILHLGFFAAPIIYPLSIIPEHYQTLLWLNPMAHLIHVAKQAATQDLLPSLSVSGLLIATSAAWLAGGALIFYRLRHNLIEKL